MSESPQRILSSRIEILLGAEAAESIAEYVCETFKVETDFDGITIQIQSYLEEILGESSAITAMAKEYVTSCSMKSNPQRKASSNEPFKSQASSSATAGMVDKRMSNNSGGNVQQKFNKQNTNTFQNKSNGAASYSAKSPSAAEMKLNLNPGKICGCMGTRHKLVGSCISCGRVTCEMELKNDGKETEKENTENSKNSISNDKISNSKSKKKIENTVDVVIESGTILCNCFTCGYSVCAPMSLDYLNKQGSSLDSSAMKAYEQKDKLLVFDREHAKRTHVHDAQADYYETGTWLSEEEKRVMDENEQRKRDARKPLNRKFKMSFDMAGRRIIEAVEEDEEEEEVGGFKESNNNKNKSNKVQDDYYSTIANKDDFENDDNDKCSDDDDDANYHDTYTEETCQLEDDAFKSSKKGAHNICKDRSYEKVENTPENIPSKSVIKSNEKGKNSKNSGNNLVSGKAVEKVKKMSGGGGDDYNANPNIVVQVIENDMLSNNTGRAGDVYRSLRSSMAVRAVKSGNDALKNEKEKENSSSTGPMLEMSNRKQ